MLHWDVTDLRHFHEEITDESLSFSESIDLDKLRRENYTVILKVVAVDQGQPRLESQPWNMTITVINVNEFHPKFAQASYSVSLWENATVMSNVYQANATDGDYGKYGQILYDISGDPDGYFSMDRDTGLITIAKQLDRETTPGGINLTIEARGFSGEAPAGTTVLHVDILDVNDNSPEFSTQLPAQSVSETASVGDTIAQVQATDDDLGDNAAISFSITAGNTDDLFEIDGEGY